MRWETRAQGVKKDRAGLAQPVAVCEMSVQHLRGAGTVCKMTMQHLHGLFTVCKMTVQHLHSPFTVCEMTMQHLHSLAAVCETAMQPLHSLVAVCETTMQPLHSLAAVCAPAPPDHSAPSGPVWRAYAVAPPTCTRQTWQASLMPPRRGRPKTPIPDAALHLPHTQIFNVYEEQQTTQHNADDGARRANRSAELAAPQATR